MANRPWAPFVYLVLGRISDEASSPEDDPSIDEQGVRDACVEEQAVQDVMTEHLVITTLGLHSRMQTVPEATMSGTRGWPARIPVGPCPHVSDRRQLGGRACPRRSTGAARCGAALPSDHATWP
ncbi:hypothetical protein GCM10017687_01710 [Streptomyces echinatus]